MAERMTVCDFARSFVTFVTPGRTNNARIQVECRCVLEAPGQEPAEFLLVASCKAEHTYAPDDLFQQPNYDFCGIFAPQDFQIIRTFATADRGGKQTGKVADSFQEVRLDLVTTPQGEVCSSNEAVVEATLANRPLVGQTVITDAGRRRATLEYPIKTMNVNDERDLFQVDTGPVLFPDLSERSGEAIERFELAFVAYNDFERAEFILLQPTPVPEERPPMVSVPHYSAIRKLPAENAIYALPT